MEGLPSQIFNLLIGAILGIVTIGVVNSLGGDWFAFDLVSIILLFIAILVLMAFADALLWKTSRFGGRFN